ncbi:MAG: hypothetical protein Q4D59_07930, partial [Erysipelotrichaceae bacterium]|nr:hypothetical protein [Erysipelotrichaceae bacterium]
GTQKPHPYCSAIGWGNFTRNYSFAAAKNVYEYGDVHGSGEKKRTMSEQEAVQLRIFAGGAADFYKDWIRGKYSLSAEEAAHAMAEILPPFLKGEIFKNSENDKTAM